MVGHVKRIKEFPAGHWYHSRLGWHKYYQLENTIRPFNGDESEAVSAIQSTLRDAVYKRLLADVPVGVSLSGGLDLASLALGWGRASPEVSFSKRSNVSGDGSTPTSSARASTQR